MAGPPAAAGAQARVYRAATMDQLRRARQTGLLAASDDVVLAAGEDEEAEYAALLSAADLSAALLAGPGRRVVVVAEVARHAVGAAIELRRVVALHADDVAQDWAADADPGADPDVELSWWATQELDALLAS